MSDKLERLHTSAAHTGIPILLAVEHPLCHVFMNVNHCCIRIMAGIKVELCTCLTSAAA